MSNMENGEDVIRCSFCGKSQDQVKKLIASEISAVKGDISWLQGTIINCHTLNAQKVNMGNALVATRNWVGQQGYLKALPSHRHSVKVGSTTYYTSYTGS